MKKILKIFMTAVIAVAAAVACLAVAGCNTNKGGADYTFTVLLPDQTPVNGQTGGKNGGKVDIQICLPNGACIPLLPEYSLDENGKITLSQSQINELLEDVNTTGGDVTYFEFHAMHVPGCTDDVKISVDKTGNHTLTLTESVCEHECLVCGKCTSAGSKESACAEKCPDHTYTVNVVANGADISNVKVKIANGERSISLALTDGALTASYKQLISAIGAAASYTVTLEGVPTGFTCSPASYNVSDTQSVTFTLTAQE